MFGYVRPSIAELKVREDAHYRAAYCGLCRCLGKRYGMSSRFLVNYDITFLYLLLAGLEEPLAHQVCFCPANPFRRKKCVPITPAMEYAADVCVILCVLSLEDARRDAKCFKKVLPAAAHLMFHRAYQKAKARQPAFAAMAREQLALLAQLEAERCQSMDRVADAFASLLSHCADSMLPGEKRPVQQLLYHVGRFLYLTDALDDLSGDIKSGNYNPLLYRFSCKDGALSPEDRAYVRESILQSVAMARAALSLCELKSNLTILENITFLGLPAVLCAVEQGVFQARRKMKATGEI